MVPSFAVRGAVDRETSAHARFMGSRVVFPRLREAKRSHHLTHKKNHETITRIPYGNGLLKREEASKSPGSNGMNAP